MTRYRCKQLVEWPARYKPDFIEQCHTYTVNQRQSAEGGQKIYNANNGSGDILTNSDGREDPSRVVPVKQERNDVCDGLSRFAMRLLKTSTNREQGSSRTELKTFKHSSKFT